MRTRRNSSGRRDPRKHHWQCGIGVYELVRKASANQREKNTYILLAGHWKFRAICTLEGRRYYFLIRGGGRCVLAVMQLFLALFGARSTHFIVCMRIIASYQVDCFAREFTALFSIPFSSEQPQGRSPKLATSVLYINIVSSRQ